MKTVLVRWMPLAVLATVVLGFTLVFVPVDRELVLRIYLVVVGGLALATFTGATAYVARRTPSAFAAAMKRPRERHPRPEELERLERQVSLSVENAADFHFRLRPTLVAAADAAVWRRYGVPLERAQSLLAPELWEVVRPDREPPSDRRAAGPPLRRIVRLLDEIERIKT